MSASEPLLMAVGLDAVEKAREPKPTHTPGPWHIGGNGFIVYAANGYAICDVKTFHGRNDSDAANADLITAAPELLEALKQARDFMEPLGPGAVLSVIDAAIAKAGAE